MYVWSFVCNYNLVKSGYSYLLRVVYVALFTGRLHTALQSTCMCNVFFRCVLTKYLYTSVNHISFIWRLLGWLPKYQRETKTVCVHALVHGSERTTGWKVQMLGVHKSLQCCIVTRFIILVACMLLSELFWVMGPQTLVSFLVHFSYGWLLSPQSHLYALLNHEWMLHQQLVFHGHFAQNSLFVCVFVSLKCTHKITVSKYSLDWARDCFSVNNMISRMYIIQHI